VFYVKPVHLFPIGDGPAPLARRDGLGLDTPRDHGPALTPSMLALSPVPSNSTSPADRYRITSALLGS
jgi:hypothetical protein